MFALTPEEITAIRLSLRVAFWATAMSLPVAAVFAFVLARYRFPGKTLLDGLIHLPLILPPVVTGYLLLLLFGRYGFFGELLERVFGIVIAFRWTGAALAAAIMGFPLMVRAMRLSFAAIDRRLEAAARSLGAPGFWVFLTVTLPLSLPGILAGALLAFGKALGEFGATITFVGNIPGETQTIPTAIFAYINVPGGEAPALRLVAISIAIALLALIASEILARRLAARIEAPTP